MSPDTSNDVTTSSNQELSDNMKEEGDDRWTSGDETTPTVTVEVAYEDSFIKTVKIENTTNVDSVTIYVIDEDGKISQIIEKVKHVNGPNQLVRTLLHTFFESKFCFDGAQPASRNRFINQAFFFEIL